MLKKISALAILIVFSLSIFAESAKKKKVVFLADGGKNKEKHAHETGNILLAEALEKSGLGIEASLHMGWPKDPKAFEGADCIVIYCNGGRRHLVMQDLKKFEE